MEVCVAEVMLVEDDEIIGRNVPGALADSRGPSSGTGRMSRGRRSSPRPGAASCLLQHLRTADVERAAAPLRQVETVLLLANASGSPTRAWTSLGTGVPGPV
jgi:hypothetical protein